MDLNRQIEDVYSLLENAVGRQNNMDLNAFIKSLVTELEKSRAEVLKVDKRIINVLNNLSETVVLNQYFNSKTELKDSITTSRNEIDELNLLHSREIDEIKKQHQQEKEMLEKKIQNAVNELNKANLEFAEQTQIIEATTALYTDEIEMSYKIQIDDLTEKLKQSEFRERILKAEKINTQRTYEQRIAELQTQLENMKTRLSTSQAAPSTSFAEQNVTFGNSSNFDAIYLLPNNINHSAKPRDSVPFFKGSGRCVRVKNECDNNEESDFDTNKAAGPRKKRKLFNPKDLEYLNDMKFKK